MSKHEQRQKLYEEFDFKEKAGSAWSHNYLNQKPWHPMSYPNQRRKWIAEQMHGLENKRMTEIEKEHQKEQEFFKQAQLLDKKQKKKAELQQAVSFLYMKPPGYNAESARAAEVEEEEKQRRSQQQGGEGEGEGDRQEAAAEGDCGGDRAEGEDGGQNSKEGEKKKKAKAVDVFGRKVVTGDDFEILKNAPRLETGLIGRPRPLGVEVRAVRCGRCGAMGHSSGERECPLFHEVTEADRKRQEREDPMAHLLQAQPQPPPHQPLPLLPAPTWQLKGSSGGGGGGFSPIRGGFSRNDPNQQIVAPGEDDIADEYGGFLLDDELEGSAPADQLIGQGDDGGFKYGGIPSSVLEALTSEQRRALKKALRKKEKDGKGKKKRRKKDGGSKKEKRKKRRRKNDSDDDSSSKSEESESESDRERSKRRKRGEKKRNKQRSPSPSSTSGSDRGTAQQKRRGMVKNVDGDNDDVEQRISRRGGRNESGSKREDDGKRGEGAVVRPDDRSACPKKGHTSRRGFDNDDSTHPHYDEDRPVDEDRWRCEDYNDRKKP